MLTETKSLVKCSRSHPGQIFFSSAIFLEFSHSIPSVNGTAAHIAESDRIIVRVMARFQMLLSSARTWGEEVKSPKPSAPAINTVWGDVLGRCLETSVIMVVSVMV